MGQNLPAVDATCSRLMGIDLHKIEYLKKASGWLGPIRTDHIRQVGESILNLQTHFALVDSFPAHQGIRL